MKKTKTKTKTDKYKYNESATVMRRGKARAGQGKVVKQVVVRAADSRLQQELLIFPTRMPDSL